MNVEKLKSDKLLSQMLPASVILQLKQQRQVLYNIDLYYYNETHDESFVIGIMEFTVHIFLLGNMILIVS